MTIAVIQVGEALKEKCSELCQEYKTYANVDWYYYDENEYNSREAEDLRPFYDKVIVVDR